MKGSMSVYLIAFGLEIFCFLMQIYFTVKFARSQDYEEMGRYVTKIALCTAAVFVAAIVVRFSHFR